MDKIKKKDIATTADATTNNISSAMPLTDCINQKSFDIVSKTSKNGKSLKSLDTRANNTTGKVGVSWKKSISRFVAFINYNKRTVTLGTFRVFEDAVYVRVLAERAVTVFSEIGAKNFSFYKSKNSYQFNSILNSESVEPLVLTIHGTVHEK